MKTMLVALCLTLGCMGVALAEVATPIPHLEKRGHATQLIVDGKPWLIIGGELTNTASSTLSNMDNVWPTVNRLNMNTVLIAIGWDWVEPQEGKFDFTLVDGLLEGARKNNKRVVFLWFGAWKNGISSFAPAWVKRDSQRFPRVRLQNGKSVEILSTFSAATLAADTRAYVKFMEHLKAADPQHTALMIQMQNEVGVHGDSRDRSAVADKLFAAAVPTELMQYLLKHKADLSPDFARLWKTTGEKTKGTWTEVFGNSPATDELFMAWQYARYLEHMTAAGKAVHALPVFTNTWLVQPEDKLPGDYPSGGPQPLTFDIWKAGAPSIDMNCPDISRPGFDEIVAQFHRANNTLFIPEGIGIASGVANAFLAIGGHNSLGYSVFGVDNTARLVSFKPPPGTPMPTDLESLPLTRGYAVLNNLTPMILKHQSEGTIAAAWLNKTQTSQDIALGDYTIKVELRRSSRDQSLLSELGYAIIMKLDKDDYVIAGSDIQVTFTPRTPGPAIVGLADAEIGSYQDGQWLAARKLNGDDILLNYKLAQQVELGQSGSGLRFLPGAPTVQRVSLYRYQ